ncbi:MAG: hypothetical protein KDJ27_14900 [Gammaproteobacteria bacterium]|nr:hypothetical protein [Gammaproteobacteria bacterium]
MAEKKPNLHKTLLILVLVFIPPYWLLFTDEGGRVSDTALLWLLGEDDMKLSVDDLSARYSQDDIKTVYSDLDWQCGDKASEFGDSVCAARIGTFNGFPSRVVTFFFRGDSVTAMRLVYREQYHEQVMGYYIGKLGQPANVAEALAAGPDADDVLEWQLADGLLLIKKVLAKTDDPSLLWLAKAPAS